jgi:hypothetical protein
MIAPLLVLLLGGAPMAQSVQDPWPVVLRPAVVLAEGERVPGPSAEAIAPAEARGEPGAGAPLPYTLGRAIVTRRSGRRSHR